jgi:hypothetical protein
MQLPLTASRIKTCFMRLFRLVPATKLGRVEGGRPGPIMPNFIGPKDYGPFSTHLSLLFYPSEELRMISWACPAFARVPLCVLCV